MRLRAGLLAVLLLAPGLAVAQEIIALFPVELRTTSLEPVRDDEIARLDLVRAELATRLEALGYRVIGTDAVRDRVADYAFLHDCGGCEASLARELGADIAAVGWVQKVSNLILNINLRLRDADSGKVIKVGSVDIRNNDDKSWIRGANYLITRRMFIKEE